MRTKHFSCLLVLLFTLFQSQAQVDNTHLKQARQLIRFIKESRANELAALVKYPLRRDNPLPNIADQQQFIKLYPVLFDGTFKQKLNSFTPDDIFERNGMYCLFSGDIWMDENGKIITLNYSSAEEQKLKETKAAEIKAQMHPSVNNWKTNILVWQSGNLLVRIDETKTGLRYAAWSKGRSISEKPDLILYNGTQEFQGTMGGVSYIFKNDKWKYVVDDVQLCELAENCGQFIRIFLGKTEKYTFHCKEIK
jgi:hypothetical protein